MRWKRFGCLLAVLSAVDFAATALRADGVQTPPPFTSPAAVYSGISGPGKPPVGIGQGGWRSGSEGIVYQGPAPKPGWSTAWGDRARGTVVTQGLLPPIQPIWDLHLRDTVICLGGDHNYYLTGSSGDNIWDRNDGVELWRSPDLKTWSYLGLVWSIEKDGTWERQWRALHGKPVRAVWAPELHYIRHNYYLCLCMAPGGIAILKSRTGKPEGPYVSALAEDRPLAGGIDPTLFEDDDGKVYFTYGGANKIARMKDDLSALAEPYQPIKLLDPGRIGHEGATLFKADGHYYLGAADTHAGRYSSMVARSDSLYGPYHDLEEAVPCGGGTDYFRDKQGRWWCGFFGNDDQSPWRERPGIVPVTFDKSGQILVAMSSQNRQQAPL